MKKYYFSELDAKNFISRYLAGESIDNIATSANVSGLTIRNTMTRHGFKFKQNYNVSMDSDLKEINFKGHTVFVSKSGKIYVHGNRNLKELTQWRHSQSKNGKKYCYGHRGVSIRTPSAPNTTTLVSRLVALAWIPNPNNLSLVCHKDETLDENGFLNNSVDNLYWGTYADNSIDSLRKGRVMGEKHKKIISDRNKGKFGEAHPKSKLTDKERKELCKLYANGESTQKELSVLFKIHPVTVHNIIKKWSKK